MKQHLLRKVAVIFFVTALLATIAYMFLATEDRLQAYQYTAPDEHFFSDTSKLMVVKATISNNNNIPPKAIDSIKSNMNYQSQIAMSARSELEYARNNYSRNKNLYDQGVITSKELSETKTVYEDLEARYMHSQKMLESERHKSELLLKELYNSATTVKLDTALLQVENKSAILGYTYPISIVRGATDYINVFVTISHNERKVRDTLQHITQAQNVFKINHDTVVIYPDNIFLYQFLTVTLIDPAKDFNMVNIHDSDRQEIDTMNGNTWRWSISTTTSHPSTQLILKVTAERPNASVSPLQQRDIPIRVDIDNRDYFKRIVFFMSDNPGWTIGGIASAIGGIISFFVVRAYNRKDKQKEKEEEEKKKKAEAAAKRKDY